MPASSPAAPVVLYSTEEAAHYLGLSPQSLCRYRLTGVPHIPFVRVGSGRGRIRYRQSDLDAYIASCVRSSTSERRS